MLIPAKITIEKKRKCERERERERDRKRDRKREYFKAVLYGLIKIHLFPFECD
jgi:hypothetical protein